jgi:transposase-like protein
MPRGVAHSPELRAQVVAAVRTGASVSEAAKRFNVDRTLVWRWTHAAGSVATEADQREQVPEGLDELTARVYGHVVATLEAMDKRGLLGPDTRPH